MISKENEIFLSQKFGINCNDYSKETVNEILDKLIDELDDLIFEKQKKNLELFKNIILNKNH